MVPGGHHLYTDLVSQGLHQLGHLEHRNKTTVIKLSKDKKKNPLPSISVQDHPICTDLFCHLTKNLTLLNIVPKLHACKLFFNEIRKYISMVQIILSFYQNDYFEKETSRFLVHCVIKSSH